MTLDRQLEDKFRETGRGPSVDFLLQQGASFSRIPCGVDKLLEDTFRETGRGPSVDFLLQQGASFSRIPCGVDKLLEDTFRETGRGPSVDFLLQQGASFSRIPCGVVDKLLEDTFRETGRGPSVDFLLQQGASFSRIPCGVDKLLEDTFRETGRGPSVDFLLQQDAFSRIPCGFNQVLKDRFCKEEAGASVDVLLRQAPAETLFKIVQYVRTLQTTTEVRNIVGYEADGIRWPEVSDGGPVRFLAMSIVYLKEKLPDSTTIIAQGRAITASKTMLSAQSPYFKVLLNPNSGFRESGQASYKVRELYETIGFAIYYGETEPHKVNWSPFHPSQDPESTAKNLDGLLDILRVADMFGMMHLHHDVQRQIVIHGVSFIGPENVCMIQGIAEEGKGRLLSSYCGTFLTLNEVI